MDIGIKVEDSAKYIDELSKTKWKLFFDDIRKYIISGIIGGVILIVLGLFKNNETIYNINIQFTIGCTFLLLSLVYMLQIQLSKQKYFDQVHHFTQRTIKEKSSLNIKITEECISYEDLDLKQVFNWNLFTFYKFHENYLFLFINEDYLSATTIDKTFLSEKELVELFDFIRNKLKEKE